MERLTVRDLESGSNQTGLRDRNARLVLSYIRRHGALPGAEIARRSGLSAQTVSNIVRALEADGLIRKGKAVKGKVGKPSIPVELNRRGVHSVGLNIGRRAVEFVLVDFLGRELAKESAVYPYPTPNDVFPFLERSLGEALQRVPGAASTLAGIGVSMPGRLWEWHTQVGAPEAAMAAWRSVDVAERIEAVTGRMPVIQNDATSACVAEHLLGQGHQYLDFVYMFVGAFVGGGLVLDGKVVNGRTGNAGAFGALPVPDGKGGAMPLLEGASLYTLEARLGEAGINPAVVREEGAEWRSFGPVLDDWMTETGRNLAIAAVASASVVEIEAVLIDGALPRWVAKRLVEETRKGLGRHDLTGITPPEVSIGDVGPTARSIGAALLPIHAKYFLA